MAAHVYGARNAGTAASKIRGVLRRTKGFNRVDGNWTYTGEPPKTTPVDDVLLAPPLEPAKPKRTCRGCRAILRAANPDEYCAPCDLSREEDYRRRLAAQDEEAVKQAARKAAAVEAKRKRNGNRVTRDELLAAMRRWVEEHDGYIPTRTEWERRSFRGEGYPVYNTYRLWFGSWRAALNAAGFETRRQMFARNAAKKRSTRFRRPYLAALPATSDEIAEKVGSTRRSVHKAMTNMATAGLVTRVPRSDGRAGVWVRVEQDEVAA